MNLGTGLNTFHFRWHLSERVENRTITAFNYVLFQPLHSGPGSFGIESTTLNLFWRDYYVAFRLHAILEFLTANMFRDRIAGERYPCRRVSPPVRVRRPRADQLI